MAAPTTTPSSPLPVLIAGAGPTGLFLAYSLHRLHIPYILIDRAPSAGLTSRALVLHTRTLEYYRMLGLATRIASAGRVVERVSIRAGAQTRGQIVLGDAGKGMSRFPYVLSLPQDEHEAIMEEELERLGSGVRRGVELVGAVEGEGSVLVRLRDRTGEEVVEVRYVCGCDGAHSKVRELAGIDMVGGTYAQRFWVADVDATGEVAERVDVSWCMQEHDFCIAVPLKRKGGVRLVGWVPQHCGEHVEFRDVEAEARQVTGLAVEKVGWFTTYRCHARVADRFRRGRMFVLGDAAHLHSPVGGQGMNTGLGDAANLAWKIAAVMQGRANEAILETYEAERQAFAKVLVNTTDYFFTLLTDGSYKGWALRNWVIPYVLPFLWTFRAARRTLYSRVSQLRIQYRESDLSEGTSGDVQGGDRVPWVEFQDGSDNHEGLSEMAWQVQVYGDLAGEVTKGLEAKGLSVHVFPWTATCEKQRFVQDSLYLVRPDGHVGLVCGQAEVEGLYAYLARWEIH